MKKKRLVYYQSIPAELKRLGLTQERASEMIGCTRSGLNHRIRADKQQIHWVIYGLANFLGHAENLTTRVD